MPIIKVELESDSELQEIADALGRSRKVVVLTGAGISTNCGLPDFRSKDGLYSIIQNQYDAVINNPPWEKLNTFDNNHRPKKKRKHWYYEVVNSDGLVVDVIDDLPQRQSQNSSFHHPPCSGPIETCTRTTAAVFSSNSSVLKSDVSSFFNSSSSRFKDLFKDDKRDSTQCSNRLSPPQLESGGQTKTDQLPESINFESLTDLSAINSTNKYAKENLLDHQLNLTETAKFSPESYNTNHSIGSVTLEHKKPRDMLNRLGENSVCSSQFSQSIPRTLPKLNGRDLFDAMIWSDPVKTSIFYMFMTNFRKKVNLVQSTSETHRFFKVLRDTGRLVRNYTQNIDRLEEKEGLSTDLTLGPGNRARFSTRNQKLIFTDKPGLKSDQFRGVEAVLLHGSLGQLRCIVCSQLCDWDEDNRMAITSRGTAPECPHCEANNSKRQGTGRRAIAVGRLRPDAVLYGEEHPNSSLISPLVTHDLSLGPDMLLVMGTSLKVHGLKVMIKEFAKAVHSQGGKVVFVNQTRPPESIWSDVIDYWVHLDCDEWVIDLKERNKEIWEPQGSIQRKSSNRKLNYNLNLQTEKRARSKALRDDNLSGAYFVSKIMKTLALGVSETLYEGKNKYKRRSFRSYEKKPAATKKIKANYYHQPFSGLS